jgi:hypothetical protein
MKLFSTLLLTFILFVPRTWAQDNASEDIVKETQSDLMIVGAAGVGGAVLGLSTLSFYDKPSSHVANIWMGAAIGIIGGVVLVAVSHAQKSQDSLESYSPKTTPDFSTSERYAWHVSNTLPTVVPTVESTLWTQSF